MEIEGSQVNNVQRHNGTSKVKFYSAATGPDWVAMGPPVPGDESTYSESWDAFNKFVTTILLSPNLIVLTGLGTSLCVTDENGNRLAPTMSDLWMAVRDSDPKLFEKILDQVDFPTKVENIELLLSYCQLSQALHPSSVVEEFIRSAESVIAEKCRFVNEQVNLDIHEAFLRKIARRPTNLSRMKLFTTNYDLCFERASSRARFTVIDGFSHTQPQEFDGIYFGYDIILRDQFGDALNYVPNVYHLYKMHGSIDWEQSGNQVVRNPNTDKPLLVYPRNSKFEVSYRPPFFEMMSRFQTALRQQNSGLLVVGFGFNDPHISQPILSALRANVNLKMIVVSLDLDKTCRENEPLAEMASLIRHGDHRLMLISGKFEHLIPQLPDLVSETEDEQHRERIRRLENR